MDFAYPASAAELRREIREVLREEWPPGRCGYRQAESHLDYAKHKEFRRRLGKHGWFGIGIRPEYGGRGGTVEEQYVVAAELAYHGVPYPEVAVNMVGPTIQKFGSEELKQRILPGIAAGEIEFSQAYSEPDAGSDLASLKTAAVRDGDDYVINGNKIYTSYIHRSEYCCIAARTDPEAIPQKGISLFVVDVNTPGITTTPLWGMGDIRTNATFWDNVRVPVANRIGDENSGWTYLNSLLDLERLTSFTVDALRAVFEDLVEYVRGATRHGKPLAAESQVRATIAELSAELEVLEALTRRALWLVSSQGKTLFESSLVKVVATELRQKLTHAALEVIGYEAQLRPEDGGGPLKGAMFRAAEGAVMQTFGAGSNEIQRDIIARRGLGLPKA